MIFKISKKIQKSLFLSIFIFSFSIYFLILLIIILCSIFNTKNNSIYLQKKNYTKFNRINKSSITNLSTQVLLEKKNSSPKNIINCIDNKTSLKIFENFFLQKEIFIQIPKTISKTKQIEKQQKNKKIDINLTKKITPKLQKNNKKKIQKLICNEIKQKTQIKEETHNTKKIILDIKQIPQEKTSNKKLPESSVKSSIKNQKEQEFEKKLEEPINESKEPASEKMNTEYLEIDSEDIPELIKEYTNRIFKHIFLFPSKKKQTKITYIKNEKNEIRIDFQPTVPLAYKMHITKIIKDIEIPKNLINKSIIITI